MGLEEGMLFRVEDSVFAVKFEFRYLSRLYEAGWRAQVINDIWVK
jgi:hypothetical protein